MYFLNQENVFTTKAILGIDEENIGGYSLDMFSNYWIFSGGYWVFYSLSLALIGFMLGKSYRFFAIALQRFGYPKVFMLVFIGLFLFAMDLRGAQLSLILLFSWILSRELTYILVIGALNLINHGLHSLFRPILRDLKLSPKPLSSEE